MSSAACSILGTAVLALLLAGYLAQKYLPPPPPKIVGIDLGTTYSCIGVYHAVSGDVTVLKDAEGHKCIPSIVAFSEGNILVGYKAAAQSDHNPKNTVYDAKRFIGKTFSREELESEAVRYPFELRADEFGQVHYVVGPERNRTTQTPEQIGSHVLRYLKNVAQTNLSAPVTKAVMSVPAEFDELQRNATRKAASLIGIDVLRLINEPTAAALAYGLHKRDNVQFVIVVDLGGGTLDVSLLHIQGGMFLTQAMAGNNHLGGQDFNERIMQHMLKQVTLHYNQVLTDPEDIQSLRLAAEQVKLRLSTQNSAQVTLKLRSVKNSAVNSTKSDKDSNSAMSGTKSGKETNNENGKEVHSIKKDRNTKNTGSDKGDDKSNKETVEFIYSITREMFEDLNKDLFQKVLEPIDKVLEAAELPKDWVDEIVLVGGSTRIPKVRELIRDYFSKRPNTAIDPELAVASGVSIQAGILGGMWPLTVSATELPSKVKKIHLR